MIAPPYTQTKQVMILILRKAKATCNSLLHGLPENENLDYELSIMWLAISPYATS